MELSSEQRLAQLIMGSTSNPLMTDGYKFSMAQAGFPLREETFYFTCRKGEPLYIPCDLKAVVNEFLPTRLPNGKERAFLATHGYGLTPAMEEALMGRVDIWCPPLGSWVLPGEPIMTITGPSFLVSWLEPLVITLQFVLQVATLLHGKVGGSPSAVAHVDKTLEKWTPSCQTEWEIGQLVASMVGTTAPPYIPSPGYKTGVKCRVMAIKKALSGDLNRAFEVGMRAATCMQQHDLAIQTCKELGLTKTSNVYLAWKHYMTPVGTTGHEHQMRWSAGEPGVDERGFKAIRDMRQEPPSYLFDTYDPIHLGLPAAFKVMAETPDRPCSLRFDSGDQDAQFRQVLEHFRPRRGEFPNLIFEDGYTADKTQINEDFCAELGWPMVKRLYGYGGYIIHDYDMNPVFNRGRVSAAYKLCRSGGKPVMKFSGSKGKESLPGLPVILRKLNDPNNLNSGYHSLVAQEGEEIAGYRPVDESGHHFYFPQVQVGWSASPCTKSLIIDLTDMCIMKGRRPCQS